MTMPWSPLQRLTPSAKADPIATRRTGFGSATANGHQARAFDGDPSRLTEMDALIAYLQSLGRLTDAPYRILAEGSQ
jgi:cytochrome c oxidase cbb3-type subunit 2